MGLGEYKQKRLFLVVDHSISDKEGDRGEDVKGVMTGKWRGGEVCEWEG